MVEERKRVAKMFHGEGGGGVGGGGEIIGSP
jgi:hypothetical protein